MPFSIMMAGDLPFHIRGSAQWPLLYFARDAAEQCDHPPRSVQILMTSMQGLPEPQVVVTSADLPPDVTVVPVDMRPMGMSVFPVPLAPGMSTQDILSAVAACFPEAADRIAAAVSTGQVALQDAQGQIFEALPQHLFILQWLVARPHGLFTPAGLPGFSTTSTTTAMQPGESTIQFMLVGDTTTARHYGAPAAGRPLRADPQGRLTRGFSLRLPPVLPWSTNPRAYIVPLLVTPDTQEHVLIMYDPGVDLHTKDILSEPLRGSGAQIYVNGVHESACNRPLVTGDFVQQFGTAFQGTAFHAGPVLDTVNRLRCLSFPLHLPALALFNGPRGTVVAPLRGAGCLQGMVNEAFEDRLDRLGRRPALASA